MVGNRGVDNEFNFAHNLTFYNDYTKKPTTCQWFYFVDNQAVMSFVPIPINYLINFDAPCTTIVEFNVHFVSLKADNCANRDDFLVEEVYLIPNHEFTFFLYHARLLIEDVASDLDCLL